MRIDIWSDVICPWCYLGKRRLERAMERLNWAGDIEIHWRAYLLDPTATAEPQDLESAINRKYGPGAFSGMKKRLGALGEAEGIAYDFDTAVRVSTLDAHRLLAWAWDEAGATGQGALKERLLRAYFEDGANVADAATLGRLAGEAGLDAAKAGEIDRVVGLELGADDYVTKPFSPRELILRIRNLLKRRSETEEEKPQTMQFGDLLIDIPRHLVSVAGQRIDLTATEFKLLIVLAQRRGRVQSREALLRDVWEYDNLIDTRTVDTHMRRLREKLGEGAQYLDTVRGVGYRFMEA